MMPARVLLITIVFVTAPAPAFTIDDALSVHRIVGEPQVSPDGSTIAYLLADWRDDDAILAHKPLGRLLVYTIADDKSVAVAERASDPAWSRSGRALAYFEGSGPERELVVVTGEVVAGTGKRFPVGGPVPRYSARYFAPVWAEGDCRVLVREVTQQAGIATRGEPYTVTSDEQRLPADAHFRDDTASRLLRIDACTGERVPLTDVLALRALHPGPDGRRVVVARAMEQEAGRFAGDTYVQPLRYALVDTDDTSERPLAMDAGTTLLGWSGDGTLLVRAPGGVLEVDAESGDRRMRVAKNGVAFATDFATTDGKLAAWGPASAADSARYLIPPPAPQRLVVAAGGSLQDVVNAEDGLEILQARWFDAGRLLVHARRLDTLAVRILSWNDGRTERLAELSAAFGPVAIAASGKVAAFAAEGAAQPPELFVLDLDSADLRQVSDHNNARYADRAFVTPDLVTSAGDAAWQALVFLPPDRAPATDLVVRAYGRQTDGRHHFNAEAQMHAARGYAYALPDVYPLRGELHSAYAAVLPGAIRQIRGDFTLQGETGFVGGSLGGYAGLVLLTSGDAADAAVLRAPPVEFTMSWATGKDRDADLLEYLMRGKRPDQDPRAYRADSPLHAAGKVGAPILFLHGSDDAQVPLWQTRAMFQALRRLGNVPSALRIYPGADHKIVRGSRARYLDFYEQLFGWWQRHLQTEAE